MLKKLINCCKWIVVPKNPDCWSLSVDRFMRLFNWPQFNPNIRRVFYAYLCVKWSTSGISTHFSDSPGPSTKNQKISKMRLMVDAKSMCGVRFFMEYFCRHTTEQQRCVDYKLIQPLVKNSKRSNLRFAGNKRREWESREKTKTAWK